MQGYVARKGERFYAVIYEGIDPLTGRERRRWYPAGTDQAVPSGWRAISPIDAAAMAAMSAAASRSRSISPSVGCRPSRWRYGQARGMHTAT
jgi:hypothetical protein